MRPSSTRALHGLGLCPVSRGGPGSSLGSRSADARSPSPRGSHRRATPRFCRDSFASDAPGWRQPLRAPSTTPPAPYCPGSGHGEAPAKAFEDISGWRRAWYGGKNGDHLTAKAGPSGLLRPEAAGLHKNTRPSQGGGPTLNERSDLDEQRPRWDWTKVRGPRIAARGTIDCWAAGLPSIQEKPGRDNRLWSIGNAGEDLTAAVEGLCI